ncbi:hypothetical protein [Brevundimonas intermedia]|uniref:hypothetical protein n=1 Tax=Brevundimonas intermedia TaxID=74315 RepID=UPI00320AB246
MTGIVPNLADVRSRISAAARRSGRDPADVTLLPISKTVPESPAGANRPAQVQVPLM